MNRRVFLRSAAAPALTVLALAGCGIVTSNTTNGVTTVTINVAKVDQYGQAFASGVTTVLGIPGVSALLGPRLIPFKALEVIVTTDVKAFDTAANGQVTLTFDSTSVPAAVASILNDGKSILSDLQTALPQTAIVGTLLDAVNAIQTIVLLFEAMLPVTGAAAAMLPPMTEAKALATLGIN